MIVVGRAVTVPVAMAMASVKGQEVKEEGAAFDVLNRVGVLISPNLPNHQTHLTSPYIATVNEEIGGRAGD